jgi:signal transduction histidine kinase
VPRWLRPWLALVVGALAVVAVLTAYTDQMVEFHHVAVPIAVGVMIAAWVLELANVGWPRLLLILGIVLPNMWLTWLGHVSANELFLILMLAWVGIVGSPFENALAISLAVATVGLGVALDLVFGSVNWAAWTSWLVGIVLVWLMSRVLAREERIVEQRDRLRSEAEERSNELSSLLTVSRSVASTLEMQPLLDAILDALSKVVDYSGAVIFTLDDAQQRLVFAHMRGPASFSGDEARSMAYQVADMLPIWERLCCDEPIIVSDVRDESADARLFRRLVRPEGEDLERGAYGFIRSLLWVPLVSRGRLTGMLSVANSRAGAYRPRDAELALAIGRQAAVALENAQLHERARQAAALEERERLARDLHDSVTQSLYGASLYAEAASRALADGDMEPASANVREVRDTLQEALGEMRLLLFELRPPLLDELGLAGALKARLQAVEARAGLETTFEDRSDGQRLGQGTEQELFRVAQEALNNILKHAHATRVGIDLEASDAAVTLEIRDNGMGFTPELDGAGGFGLEGMQQRMERLGGTLRIESSPGNGTRVQARIPR